MIRIQNLQYRYPDGTQALHGVDLTISDGEFVLICGPNGSGKTTLIRHIKGLLKPTAGSITVDGFDTVSQQREVLWRVGMVFQDADSQIVGETVLEDVAFGPENLGLSRDAVKARVFSALEKVGMGNLADKPCHLLSGGEKRRLAIAGVLAMEPHVLIFDEPFANLDYAGVRQVLHQIVGLHQKGHTILLTTHDVEKVVAHTDRIAILSAGKLRAIGVPESIVPQLALYQIREPCYSLYGQKALSWLTD